MAPRTEISVAPLRFLGRQIIEHDGATTAEFRKEHRFEISGEELGVGGHTDQRGGVRPSVRSAVIEGGACQCPYGTRATQRRCFRGMPLNQVAEMFNQHYRPQLVLSDATFNKLEFSGFLRQDDLPVLGNSSRIEFMWMWRIAGFAKSSWISGTEPTRTQVFGHR